MGNRQAPVASELLDRLPPQNMDAERSLLGSVLLSSKVLDDVTGIIKPEDFYGDAHRRLYATMLSLHDDNQPVDAISIVARLRTTAEFEAVGGHTYLAELAQSVAVAAHAAYHAKLISEAAVLRNIRNVAVQMILGVYAEQSPREILEEAEAKLMEVGSGRDHAPQPASKAAVAVMDEIDRQQSGDRRYGGFLTGIAGFDENYGGLFRGELVILAARPGVGKCLGRGTLVMLHDGSLKKVEDIKDGTLLMGPDSKPRRVHGTTRGFGPLFLVSQTKGSPYVVNENHILSLQLNKTCWRYTKDETVNISITDYLASPVRFKHGAKGWKAGIRRQRKNVLRTGINVTPAGEGEYFGFELDGDGLFLLHDFTVTHNTSLACQIALHGALRGRKSYFASLEMAAAELLTRVICGAASVSMKLIRTGRLTPAVVSAFVAAAEGIAQQNWWIHDAPRLTTLDIRRWSRRLKSREGLDLVIVDYLQRLTPTDRRANRWEQVGQMTDALKSLARELEVPVLCLTQLNRDIEKEKKPRPPRLSDLRESGSIEQDADVVVFLHCTDDRILQNKTVPPDVPIEIELRVEKNRNGERGRLQLGFIPAYTRFQSLTDDPWPNVNEF